MQFQIFKGYDDLNSSPHDTFQGYLWEVSSSESTTCILIDYIVSIRWKRTCSKLSRLLVRCANSSSNLKRWNFQTHNSEKSLDTEKNVYTTLMNTKDQNCEQKVHWFSVILVDAMNLWNFQLEPYFFVISGVLEIFWVVCLNHPVWRGLKSMRAIHCPI